MSSAGVGVPRPPPREVRQDMPPKGGYAPIDVRRNVPKSVSPMMAWLLLGGGAAVVFGGLINVAHTNQWRRKLKKERMAIRENITPFLQSESDVEFVVQSEEFLRKEAEIMKNRPKWQVGKNVYYTKDFVSPTNPDASHVY
ncbi:NADH dehydrogenase ubiquinone 1 alpha subcomplex subunit 13-A [Porphyridium purpureum]|uniref:NADH dehydrogenase [ubiquinone] 1 alpha subcomplex subunit 13 n=1 Tax=Porphyridium purpureum TaxID=35688 RepID=A0A5J4YLF4_PORPP|nr:NADH dehydrogenase ubiquinone 1 alpha subcomplex subunit 13-A [Porphyridium purpureum]|eukprot:POR4714..scf246_12